MLKMRWTRDHDGRLVATWIQTSEPGSTDGRQKLLIFKMQWTIDHEGHLVPNPAPSGESQLSFAFAEAGPARWTKTLPPQEG
jgi:hypothetical protein